MNDDVIPAACPRYDSRKPADLAQMIASGVIWYATYRSKMRAIDAILAGVIPMPDNLPDDAREYLERVRRARIE